MTTIRHPLAEVVKSVRLPEGIQWLDGDDMIVRLATPGPAAYMASWVGFLIHMEPAARLGEEPRFFVHRVNFDFEKAGGVDEDRVEFIRQKVAAHAAVFQHELASGLAVPVIEGGLLP